MTPQRLLKYNKLGICVCKNMVPQPYACHQPGTALYVYSSIEMHVSIPCRHTPIRFAFVSMYGFALCSIKKTEKGYQKNVRVGLQFSLEEPCLFHQKAKRMLVCKCLNRTMTIEHLRMAEAQAPLYINHPDQHHILQTQILGFRQTRGLIVTTGTHF